MKKTKLFIPLISALIYLTLVNTSFGDDCKNSGVNPADINNDLNWITIHNRSKFDLELAFYAGTAQDSTNAGTINAGTSSTKDTIDFQGRTELGMTFIKIGKNVMAVAPGKQLSLKKNDNTPPEGINMVANDLKIDSKTPTPQYIDIKANVRTQYCPDPKNKTKYGKEFIYTITDVSNPR